MSIGTSGRIVLEIEPSLKRQLYAALALDQSSLKKWFVLMAEEYVRSQHQSHLFPTIKASDLPPRT